MICECTIANFQAIIRDTFPQNPKVTAIKHLTYHLNIRVIAFLSTDKLAVALFFIVGGNCYEFVMNYTHILTDFMIKQFDVKKLEEIVKAFLELVETATLILDDKDYYIRITPTYEVELVGKSSVRNTCSKIETFMIYEYDSKDKLRDLIVKYPSALEKLTKEEKELFIRCFMNKEKKTYIQEAMILHQYQYDRLKKSAIIKFCVFLGLDKYINNF